MEKRITALSKINNVPTISFGMDSFASDVRGLVSEKFTISGNEITAFYDSAHKLIFVLDLTIDSRKPNALLILNSVSDRKWDDILANDYGVALETIRPKIDNKYQKLDIDYDGLALYNKLINEYTSENDLTDVLSQLSQFRDASVHRSASERLIIAEEIILKSQETITRAKDALRDAQSEIKQLREKLSTLKKEVGRVPTKQSAAKILKTEAQIDTANDKILRIKKRLANAQKRMTIAEHDADTARKILNTGNSRLRENDDIEIIESSGENMTTEVKPLFDKDPEILDEKIAFKPIEFNTRPVSSQHISVSPQSKETVFAPIEINQQPIAVSDQPSDIIVETVSEPLYFTPPVSMSETTPDVITDEPQQSTPIVNDIITPIAPIRITPQISEPVMPISAPVADVRPISPITGDVVPLNNGGRNGGPNALYYIMLIALIILSVFTLWLYQRSTTDTVPELTVRTTPTVIEPVIETPTILSESAPAASGPFIVTAPPSDMVQEPMPVTTLPATIDMLPSDSFLVEPEYIEDVYTAPVANVPAEIPAEQPQEYYEEEVIYNTVPETPIGTPAPENEIIAKPAYEVNTEQPFVADEYYETDRLPDGSYYSE